MHPLIKSLKKVTPDHIMHGGDLFQRDTCTLKDLDNVIKINLFIHENPIFNRTQKKETRVDHLHTKLLELLSVEDFMIIDINHVIQTPKYNNKTGSVYREIPYWNSNVYDGLYSYRLNQKQMLKLKATHKTKDGGHTSVLVKFASQELILLFKTIYKEEIFSNDSIPF